MATLVISPELQKDVQRLADATGASPTEAIAEAVHGRLKLIAPAVDERKIDMSALYAFLDTLPGTADYTLTDDEILGYDESGAPEQPWLNGPR